MTCVQARASEQLAQLRGEEESRIAGAVLEQFPAEQRQTALSALADGEGAASEYAASLLRQPTPELTEAVGDGVGAVPAR